MAELKCLNIGCGNKFHPAWENIDLASNHREVKTCNVLKGLPYPDNHFDVVYHSQFLEHISKAHSVKFIKDCHRVLKVGGIMRVVVPDLENIITAYQKLFKQNLTDPTPQSEADYDWIMLELLDQMVRRKSGGLMKPYLETYKGKNSAFLRDRLGHVGREIQDDIKPEAVGAKIKREGMMGLVSRKLGGGVRRFMGILLGRKYRVGQFRMQGEVHLWMYDRYSLQRLLHNCAFKQIKQQSPFTSDIPNWDNYELDVKNNLAFDPTSLFMEGKK